MLVLLLMLGATTPEYKTAIKAVIFKQMPINITSYTCPQIETYVENNLRLPKDMRNASFFTPEQIDLYYTVKCLNKCNGGNNGRSLVAISE